MKFYALLMSIILLLVLVIAPEPHWPLPRAEAATFTVDTLADESDGDFSAGDFSLREAIEQANAAGGADVIDFSVIGTILLTDELFVTDDLTLNGSGIALDGGNSTRIMYVAEGTVVLNDLSFQNGWADPGGAILNGGTLTVIGSTFSNNTANSGIPNGVYSGGAIYSANGATLTIIDSTFSGNQATSGNGGAIDSNDGTLTVSGSTFSGNTAMSSTFGIGGAIKSGPGTLVVTASTFSDNTAEAAGGAISNGGTATITNSTFSSNAAINFGGGAVLNFLGGTITITSNTFSGNTANYGGAISSSATATISSNVIVDGNCAGSVTDGGNNLSFNATGCPGTVADPELGPLQNNGGPTDTMLPALIGPAVDVYSAPCATATDQRGITRPQGWGCDIGATEQIGPPPLGASAACNGPNLEVTITAGNGPFNITASAGINTPVNGVSIGTTTINGPEKWDNVTVSETTGDLESIDLGQFRCRSDESPVPVWPAHRSHTTSMYPLFSWTGITGANNYRIFVFDDASLATRTVDIRQNSGGPTSMQLTTPLPDGRLFWRVRGRQNRIWSLWSTRFTLFKDPVAPLSAGTPVPTIDLNPPSGDSAAPSPAPTLLAPPNSR